MRHKLSDIVWLDFETYYSKDYSLKKKTYTTSSYIRDPQFRAHCVAIRDGPRKPSVWYEHRDLAKAFKKHRLAERPICCHNTSFDAFVLSEHYGIVPPYYYDTLSMARGLHGTLTRNDLDTVGIMYGVGGKKPNVLRQMKGVREPEGELLDLLGDYCANDNDRCYDISRIQLKVYPNDELDLIDWTVRCFADPVLLIDQALIKEQYDEEIANKSKKVELAGVNPEILQSAEMFAEALRALNIEPPTKVSKTTGELTYAFSKQDWAFTDMLNWEDRPDVVRLVEARLAVKSTIGETRAKRFLDIGSGTMPVGNNYCAAHTTRWGGGNKCLAGDTTIIVLRDELPQYERLDCIQNDDLVWDGELFVPHSGLLDQGVQEVITHDGITGTPDHDVFIDEHEGKVRLDVALRESLSIKAGSLPCGMESASQSVSVR